MKPITVHMIPVFAQTDEPGWIILTKKKKAKIAQPFAKFSYEEASWEPDIKSWFVHHGKISDAIGLMQENGAVFCQECSSGKACSAWAGIEDGGFLFRGQDELIPPDRNADAATGDASAEDASGTNADEDDEPITPVDPEWWVEFTKIFFGPRSRFRPQDTQPSPQGMPPEQAAAALGVPWPCTWEQLTKAFRTAAMKAHPDHGGSTEEMAKINLAREVLTKHLAEQGARR